MARQNTPRRCNKASNYKHFHLPSLASSLASSGTLDHLIDSCLLSFVFCLLSLVSVSVSVSCCILHSCILHLASSCFLLLASCFLLLASCILACHICLLLLLVGLLLCCCVAVLLVGSGSWYSGGSAWSTSQVTAPLVRAKSEDYCTHGRVSGWVPWTRPRRLPRSPRAAGARTHSWSRWRTRPPR